MSRVKDFNSTGLAPNGRLYAGDLNAMQDQYADIFNLSQSLGAASISVGEAGLQLLRYGAGEARLSGALRTDGVLRGLGGIVPGGFTTAQRDVIPAGQAPYGLEILNTTTNQFEWNSGTDAARLWTPMGGGVLQGAYSLRPVASAGNTNRVYYALDKDVMYLSTGAAWVRIGVQCGVCQWTFSNAAYPGTVLLQGQTVPRTGIYDELFALWGTAYNTGGEAGTDFRLPDVRGRELVMVGTNASISGLGGNDGVAVANRRGPRHRHTAHAHTVNAHAHGGGNHAHGVNDPTHAHTTSLNWDQPRSTGTFNPGYYAGVGTGYTDPAYTGISIAASGVVIAAEAPATNAIDGGSAVAADPLDGGAWIVANLQVKL